MFFNPAVTLLQESGHEILCTSRHYREAIELAKLKNLKLKIVGSHGGAERYEKVRESSKRIFEGERHRRSQVHLRYVGFQNVKPCFGAFNFQFQVLTKSVPGCKKCLTSPGVSGLRWRQPMQELVALLVVPSMRLSFK